MEKGCFDDIFLPMIIWGCRLLAIGINRLGSFFGCYILVVEYDGSEKKVLPLALDCSFFLLRLTNGISMNPRNGETCKSMRVCLDVRKAN